MSSCIKTILTWYWPPKPTAYGFWNKGELIFFNAYMFEYNPTAFNISLFSFDDILRKDEKREKKEVWRETLWVIEMLFKWNSV